MHNFKLTALISLLLINIFGMESSKRATEKTSLLEEVVVEKFNTQLINSDQNLIKLGIKTDSDFIRLLPTEVWLNIIKYLEPKEKALLYIFAPRIGVTEEQAKVIAVNISNFCALKFQFPHELKRQITLVYDIWGNLKNYEDKNNFAEKSKAKIRKYLNILNSSFLHKIDLYDKAIISEKKKEAFQEMWSMIESDMAKILELANIEHGDDKEFYPKISKNPKRAYLETKKYLMFEEYNMTNARWMLISIYAYAFITLLPLPYYFINQDVFFYYELGTQGLFIISLMICCFLSCIKDRNYLKEQKDLFCRKNNNLQDFSIPRDIFILERRLRNYIDDCYELNTFEAEMLEFLNEQLKTGPEDPSLDQLLIEALKDLPDLNLNSNSNGKQEIYA